MPHIRLSQNGTSPHERLLGHNARILERWLQLETAFFQSTTFHSELLEQVRRALALGNRCEYCIAKAGPPNLEAGDERVRLAVAFAELVGRDHRDVSEAHIAMLREHFSEAEISELISFVSFITASQIVGATLGLSAMDQAAFRSQSALV